MRHSVLVLVLALLAVSLATATAAARWPTNEADLSESLVQIRDHQSDADRIIQLATRGAFKGTTWNRLAEMTDIIGSRLCGSDSLADAVNWTISALQKEGFDNVHGEPTTEIQWVRGNEYATLSKPRARPYNLIMLGLGNSIGTGPNGIEADVVVVRNQSDLNSRNDIKGKIVVWNPYCNWTALPINCYGQMATYRSQGAVWAAKAGAVASLVRSVTGFSMKTPHTGSSQTTTIPAAALTIEDVDMLQRFQDRGLPVTIKLYMEAKMLSNRQGYNVVADITGTTKPNEIVLVSGHLDSWDVGSGAMDDGGGAFISWSALSLMKLANLRAQRTVRLVMWSCEEQGGLGGNQYWQDHQKEVKDFDIVFESDLGTFKPLGLQLTASNSYARQMVTEVGQLLSAINTTAVTTGGEGTDIQNWINAGVPAASLYNDNSRYFNYHHTHADSMNIYSAGDMDLAAATWAVFSYVLADIDAMLPRNSSQIVMEY